MQNISLKRLGLLFLVTIMFTSCGDDSYDTKRIEQESKESLEAMQKHIRSRREMYEEKLQDKIKETEQNLNKLKDVSADQPSAVGDDLNNSILRLEQQKASLESTLKNLRKESDQFQAETQSIHESYNAQLNAIVKRMEVTFTDYDRDLKDLGINDSSEVR
ncbi:MAG: hypothetical protein M3Q97_02585 [Bacteroidota bacterium]|nr:hypothetical protein [Bacteroidota bacterium]